MCGSVFQAGCWHGDVCEGAYISPAAWIPYSSAHCAAEKFNRTDVAVADLEACVLQRFALMSTTTCRRKERHGRMHVSQHSHIRAHILRSRKEGDHFQLFTARVQPGFQDHSCQCYTCGKLTVESAAPEKA